MSNKLPVIAVIPNYNMADSLTELLPQVLQQEYDDVFVLDDASTDHSQEVINSFGKAVHFISSAENKGAGATRNRIIPAIGHEAVIHFIDADMRLTAPNLPELARASVANPDVSFVGGLVTDTKGWQSVWNYGPRQCASNDLRAPIQARIETLLKTDSEKAERLHNRFANFLQDWPNPFEKPAARKIFWALESNLVIKSTLFEAIGGYDENLREHEIQDLAIRLDKWNLSSNFEPLVSAIHTAVQVRNANRGAAMGNAELYIARKHGLKNWLLPNGHFTAHL